MPQCEYAALCEGAENFQYLRKLYVDDMRFSRDIVLPHGLQWVVFRNVYFWGVVRLAMCRCATTAITEERVLGSLNMFLAHARLSEFSQNWSDTEAQCQAGFLYTS